MLTSGGSLIKYNDDDDGFEYLIDFGYDGSYITSVGLFEIGGGSGNYILCGYQGANGGIIIKFSSNAISAAFQIVVDNEDKMAMNSCYETTDGTYIIVISDNYVVKLRTSDGSIIWATSVQWEGECGTEKAEITSGAELSEEDLIVAVGRIFFRNKDQCDLNYSDRPYDTIQARIKLSDGRCNSCVDMKDDFTVTDIESHFSFSKTTVEPIELDTVTFSEDPITTLFQEAFGSTGMIVRTRPSLGGTNPGGGGGGDDDDKNNDGAIIGAVVGSVVGGGLLLMLALPLVLLLVGTPLVIAMIGLITFFLVCCLACVLCLCLPFIVVLSISFFVYKRKRDEIREMLDEQMREKELQEMKIREEGEKKRRAIEEERKREQRAMQAIEDEKKRKLDAVKARQELERRRIDGEMGRRRAEEEALRRDELERMRIERDHAKQQEIFDKEELDVRQLDLYKMSMEALLERFPPFHAAVASEDDVVVVNKKVLFKKDGDEELLIDEVDMEDLDLDYPGDHEVGDGRKARFIEYFESFTDEKFEVYHAGKWYCVPQVGRKEGEGGEIVVEYDPPIERRVWVERHQPSPSSYEEVIRIIP